MPYGHYGKPSGVTRSVVRQQQAQLRQDGWVNVLTGLGTALRDKRKATTFQSGYLLTDSELEDLYHHDDIAARVCDVVPEEMMRSGFDLTVEGGDQDGNKVMQRWEELGAHEAFVEAMVWGRAFGGGGIYLGVEDGKRPDDEPLPERIERVQFLTVFDKRQLVPRRYYQDPFGMKYGKPETYVVYPTHGGEPREVHETRLIVFGGARTSAWRKRNNGGWGYSVLQRMWDALTQFADSFGGVAHLMTDLSQAVFKFKDLMSLIAGEQEDQTIAKRMELIELSRSVCRSVLLDSEEDFERKPTPLTGVPETLQLFQLRLCAAARMPATLLFGREPAGMNATGESDTRWWYNLLESDRETYLKPQIKRLLSVLWAEQEGGAPAEWGITFRGLWEPTQKEQAEIRKMTSEADKIDIDSGILTPEEVALSRYTPHGYSTETKLLDREAREKIAELELERAVEEAEDPPPPPPAIAPPGTGSQPPPEPTAPEEE